MARKYEFNWTFFFKEDLLRGNANIDEDLIIGFVPFERDGEKYIIDIHHEHYSAKEKCFDLEVYKSNEHNEHIEWLFSDKSIKTSTKYTNFCRRAEDAVIKGLTEYELSA